MFSDDFQYANGSLTGQGTWITNDGGLSDLLVVSHAAESPALDAGANQNDAAVFAGIDWNAPLVTLLGG